MKRHLVMDLFCSHLREPVEGDWNKIEDGLPKTKCTGTKVIVKLKDDSETYAYFYKDKGLCAEYVENLSYFWDCTTKENLPNVVAWKYLKDAE
jgi:hypothetical protein